MSEVSLKAIRIPRVTSGLAPNAQSERTFNQNYIINPNRDLSDNYGRPAGIDSLDALTVGHDPLYRIEAENLVYRPNIHPYLDMESGLAGGFGRDTLGVRRDESFGLQGHYAVGPNRNLSNAQKGSNYDASYADQDRMNLIERTKFEKRRFTFTE